MTVTVDQTVEQFTATPRQLFINGEWTDAASGKTFETPNPATGGTLANVAGPVGPHHPERAGADHLAGRRPHSSAR
jgi:hypothetical protein